MEEESKVDNSNSKFKKLTPLLKAVGNFCSVYLLFIW